MNKEKVQDILSILLLSILGIALQMLFLNPPILSDQLEYYFWALRFPHWPTVPNLEITRLGLVLPVAVLYRIFGSAEVTYYSFQILCFVLIAVSIYLIGEKLFSFRIGVFSAVWFLVIPNLLLESGHLLPDIPATALFTSGCAFIIGNHSDSFPPKRRFWAFLLAGIFFGWSYLTKETTAILFPLVPILLWTLGIPIRRMIPIMTGMLSMLIFEMVFGVVFFGNPLFHFMAASPRETIGYIQENAWINLIYLVRLLNKTNAFGAFIILILGAIGAIIFGSKKEKAPVFLLTWVVLVYGVFSMVGLLPVILGWEDKVLLRLHKFRYWIPILPPLVISGIVLVDRSLKRLAERITKSPSQQKIFLWGIPLLLLILTNTMGIQVIWKDPDLIRNGNDHYIEFRNYLKEQGQEINPIWIDRDNHRAFERVLPIYTHDFIGNPVWNGRMKYINTGGQYLKSYEIDSGYIIVDNFFMDPALSGAPLYLTQPPKNWKRVFQSKNGQIALYQVD